MNPGNPKRVCILTNGCPENRIDCSHLAEFFNKSGWLFTANYSEAELIIFNACGLTESKEDDSINIADFLQKSKSVGAKLIVCGCLPKINKERLAKTFNGVSFGGYKSDKLSEVINARCDFNEICANSILPVSNYSSLNYQQAHLSRKNIIYYLGRQALFGYNALLASKINLFDEREHNKTFFIKIASGCLDNCAYCAVKRSRGRLKSKRTQTILREFNQGLKRGYNRFALLGTDLGPYGKDIGSSLAMLLEEILKQNGNYKIGLRNLQPRWLIPMFPELKEIFKSNKIYFVGIPVESGSDTILSSMNRKYTIEQYKKCVREINNTFPDIFIRTQIMVGFPGETENDFRHTLRLLDELVFDYVEVYPYSKRPKTKAATMKDQVPHVIVKKRYKKMFVKALLNRTPRKLKHLLAKK